MRTVTRDVTVSLRMLTYVHTNPPRDLVEYRVLGELAVLADARGYCTVGQRLLATRCELSRSTVRAVLDRLEQDGRIQRFVRRDEGPRARHGYYVVTDMPPAQLSLFDGNGDSS